MEGLDYRAYFLQPSDVSQRRYEALRAVFVEQQSLKHVAGRFDVSYGTVRNWVSEFRRSCDAGQAPPFSLRREAVPQPADAMMKNPKFKPPTSGRCR
jgi:transposase-like protein